MGRVGQGRGDYDGVIEQCRCTRLRLLGKILYSGHYHPKKNGMYYYGFHSIGKKCILRCRLHRLHYQSDAETFQRFDDGSLALVWIRKLRISLYISPSYPIPLSTILK